jgi:hypothetical protein
LSETPVTANDIITDAVQKLNVYAPGETLSSADANRGFQALLDLIDQWTDDSIYLYQLLPIELNLENGVSVYTITPGAGIAIPSRVALGSDQVTIVEGPTSSYANSVSSIEWNLLYSSYLTLPPATPLAMWYETSTPANVARFSPIPNANMVATFNGWYSLPTFIDLSTDYVLTPGEQLALTSNLAIFLNSYFGSTQVTQELLAQAQQSKTTLTYTNRLSRALSKRNVEPSAPGNVSKP